MYMCVFYMCSVDKLWILGEHKMQSEDLRRALSDVQSFNELEQRLKKELEVC